MILLIFNCICIFIPWEAILSKAPPCDYIAYTVERDPLGEYAVNYIHCILALSEYAMNMISIRNLEKQSGDEQRTRTWIKNKSLKKVR